MERSRTIRCLTAVAGVVAVLALLGVDGRMFATLAAAFGSPLVLYLMMPSMLASTTPLPSRDSPSDAVPKPPSVPRRPSSGPPSAGASSPRHA